MSLRKRMVLGVSCLPVFFAAAAMANVTVQKPIDKADECGYVVDQSGLPVADATLTASSGDFKVTATSSSDGSFLFPETSNRSMSIEADAKGFSRAEGTVAHLEAAGEKKCKLPIYVVLFVGNVDGNNSFLTVKKKDVPKPPKQPTQRSRR